MADPSGSATGGAGLEPGSRLDTRVVGPPIGGLLALWDEANERTLWQVARPAELATLLGRGLVTRTAVEPGRYREACVFHAGSGTLLVADRIVDPGSHDSAVRLRGSDFQLAPSSNTAPSDDEAWSELAEWLGSVYEAAAERGEFVVVERGGWTFPPTPYVLSLVRPGDDGQTLSHLECAPAPLAPTLWPGATDPAARGQTVTAPARPDTIRVGGHLAVDAARRWATSPHDLGITFGPIPRP